MKHINQELRSINPDYDDDFAARPASLSKRETGPPVRSRK